MNTSNLALLMIIIVSLGLFVMIYGIVYLRNKERMAMIERGIDLNTSLPKLRKSNPAFVLTFGLLLIGCGLGLFIAYLMDYFVFQISSDNPAIYFSLISIFGGSGLFISYLIERKSSQKKEL